MRDREVLWRGPTRVYFNSYAEGNLFWSVDQGDLSTEVKCTRVEIQCAGNRGLLSTAVQAESKIQPRAWLQSADSRVSIDSENKVIVIEVFG